jgi:hypothetical protein
MSLARLLSVFVLCAATGTVSAAPIIAYDVPAGTVGNQDFGGSLGMDFNVGSTAILVTSLGVFDSGSNGLSAPLSVAIFDRTTQTIVPGTLVNFPTGTPGTLIGGSRFIDVPDVVLAAGFQGSVVAWGYNGAEPNGNTHGGPAPWTTNGGGLISFVGSSRFGFTPGAFPNIPDGGPVNRYAAGTFQFEAVPEPTTLAVFGLMAVGGLGYVRRRKPAIR